MGWECWWVEERTAFITLEMAKAVKPGSGRVRFGAYLVPAAALKEKILARCSTTDLLISSSRKPPPTPLPPLHQHHSPHIPQPCRQPHPRINHRGLLRLSRPYLDGPTLAVLVPRVASRRPSVPAPRRRPQARAVGARAGGVGRPQRECDRRGWEGKVLPAVWV
jgi:hypothetical protein